MQPLLSRFLGLVLATQAWAGSHPTPPPTVDLGYATYTGNHLPCASQNEFLGIRYGAAPVGDLRFRAPRSPPQQGHKNATTFPPLCYGVDAAPGTAGESEDCLFLSVYAPSDLGNKKVPVWFLIQGGGFNENSNGNYNGSTLLSSTGNKMVFVEFQYRIGLYGFLASQDIKDNGNLNAGLLDQRAALLWVQKYISKFGGDPSQVVIVGDSAGATSVALHLISYGGKGHPSNESKAPFVGAVGISPGFSTGATVPSREWQYDTILQRTNCTTGKLACLRGMDSNTLQAANTGMALPGGNTTVLSPFGPTVDGSFIQDAPNKLLANGTFLKVPVIFGDDTDEGTNFVPNATSEAEAIDWFKNQFPGATDQQIAVVLSQYSLATNPPTNQHGQYFSVLANAYGEFIFICTGIRLDAQYRNAGVNSWNYRYDVLTAENVALGIGSPHTSELRTLFGGTPALGAFPARPPDAPAIAKSLRAYYTNFVRFLDPNGSTRRGGDRGSPVPVRWPTFNTSQPRLLFQLESISLESISQAQKDRCAFWDQLVGQL